ncbi:MAG: hypothetical protein LBG15_13275 [Dysgonamonadaceae bacterium]|jgi:hypothetical protein|nr:hypothetical protein [Dysgonamonadaceae bacterium]
MKQNNWGQKARKHERAKARKHESTKARKGERAKGRKAFSLNLKAMGNTHPFRQKYTTETLVSDHHKLFILHLSI